MAVRINDEAPNFTADTTEGKLDFYDWKGDSWAVLFSHPKDYTPVCTTELGAVAGLKGEFEKRGVKVIGLSVDPVDSHSGWAADIKEVTGNELNFPLIADPSHEIAEKYDMLPATSGTDLSEVLTVRSVYVIGPDNKIKLSLTYPASTGRNFQEILRAIDSLQLTAKHSVATPADWKQGEDVIIANSVNDDDAKAKFGDFTKVKPYLRTTKQPK
jgi:alkyl hydroperoxide reductase subunit AhpC